VTEASAGAGVDVLVVGASRVVIVDEGAVVVAVEVDVFIDDDVVDELGEVVVEELGEVGSVTTLGHFGFNGYSSDWEDQNYWTVAGHPVDVASGERPSWQGGISIHSVFASCSGLTNLVAWGRSHR
jgi:hypothetical protein